LYNKRQVSLAFSTERKTSKLQEYFVMSETQSSATQAQPANQVVLPVAGSAASRVPVEPGTMLSIRQAYDATLSPDGQRVAFTLSAFVADQQKAQSRIWTVETSGKSEARPLTRGPKDDMYPRWSPDSRQLAYVSTGEGEKEKPQLYVIAADGGEAKRVCAMPNGVSNPEWAPDGSRIAFLSLEGEEPQTDPLVVGPARHRRLWTVRPDFALPEPVTPDNLTVWEYAWSPDGKQIAVYYSMGPGESDWYNGQIGIVPAVGGAVRQISRLEGQASSLAWSPDGKYIACITGNWSDRGLRGGDLFIQSIEGGEARNLTPDGTISLSWCCWFPDGKRLLYAAWSGVTHQIGLLNERDGSMETLAEDFVIGERFGPRFSATPDLRQIAVTHATHEHPYDVWFGELSGEGNAVHGVEWRRLTRLNPIAEETLAIAPTERIRYESVDGWLIDALFTSPFHPAGETPPPLVVHVHGGPSSAYVDSWGGWAQVLASAGFAVLEPNIRGSQGRGTAFSDAVLGDMGGKDFQDIMYGVDYLIQRVLVDADRVGIVGWSYGGFMTAWAVTQTNRFKAAMMGAGICDFHSFHAQTNIPDWDRRFIGADMLEHPEAYRERSAITYAARVTTPTLIIHGEKDECVPVNQAYAFQRALQERGVPVELVVYPREGHGPKEKDHLRDLEERLVRWCTRYVLASER
jgi:dipeptidyl aminopeptidase/acylaminoacyl peptidase